MTKIEETIDVEVPLHTAYNQWTQFEQFPRFMEGIKEVRQVDDAHLHWVAEIEGKTVEWDSELVQQVPDQVIAWHTVSGAFNSGTARFTPLDEGRTRIVLEMSTDSPRDGGGTPPDHAQASTRARADLQRFKAMIEAQGGESGAWRGEIQDARVVGGNGADTSGHSSAGAVDSTSATSQATPQSTSQATPPTTGARPQSTAATARRAMTGNPANWLPQMISMWEEPLTMMRRMSEEMDRMVERYTGRPAGFAPALALSPWTPSVEILQSGDQLLIAADLPGMSKEDVSIEIRDDKLFIEGQRQESSSSGEQSSRRSTRRFGRFYRMIALPSGVDADRAQATMEHGVLQVTLPLTSVQDRGRRLEIQQAQQAMPGIASAAQQESSDGAEDQMQASAISSTQPSIQPSTQPSTQPPTPAPSQPSLH